MADQPHTTNTTETTSRRQVLKTSGALAIAAGAVAVVPGVSARGDDARLLALWEARRQARKLEDDANSAYQPIEQELIDDAKALGLAPLTPTWKAWRKREEIARGMTVLEKEEMRQIDRGQAIEWEIAETPAHTLHGLLIKLRLVQTEYDVTANDMELADGLVADVERMARHV